VLLLLCFIKVLFFFFLFNLNRRTAVASVRSGVNLWLISWPKAKIDEPEIEDEDEDEDEDEYEDEDEDEDTYQAEHDEQIAKDCKNKHGGHNFVSKVLTEGKSKGGGGGTDGKTFCLICSRCGFRAARWCDPGARS